MMKLCLVFFRNSAIFCALAAALVMQGGLLATRTLADTHSLQRASAQKLAQNQEPVVDRQAEELLQAMSNLLESAPGLAFTIKETRDLVTSTGLPLQVSHIIEAVAQRSDKLWLNITGDVAERTFWDDGRNVTLFDRENNIFATRSSPGKLTDTINTMIDTYDVDLPMAELFMTCLYDFQLKHESLKARLHKDHKSFVSQPGTITPLRKI